MPIENAFKPDIRPFPDDYMTWANKPKRWYMKLDRYSGPGRHTWVLTGRVQPSRFAGNKHAASYSFTLLPIIINKSVNWRRLVAAHLRALRFAIRRQEKPWTIDERKKPQLPWPM